MTYIIMGPQGSGKGTQAKLLAKEYGLEHVSIGDVLRREVALGTENGKIIERYMNEGKLIPFHINNSVVRKEIERNNDIIIDGYPRNRAQAEYLLSFAKIKGIIVINISEEESLRRLSKRLICTANNKIFIEDKISDEDKQECASLGGEIVKRDDDRPEAITKRLQIYHEDTIPVIDFLKEKDVPVIEINGEQPVQELFHEIKKEAEYLFK